jgi:hypothetical protein
MWREVESQKFQIFHWRCKIEREREREKDNNHMISIIYDADLVWLVTIKSQLQRMSSTLHCNTTKT